jgi:hypothetical protein
MGCIPRGKEAGQSYSSIEASDITRFFDPASMVEEYKTGYYGGLRRHARKTTTGSTIMETNAGS